MANREMEHREGDDLPGCNAMGPRDQRAVVLRDDELLYNTPVLA